MFSIASIKITLDNIFISLQFVCESKNNKSETKIERKEQTLSLSPALNVPKKARHYKG